MAKDATNEIDLSAITNGDTNWDEVANGDPVLAAQLRALVERNAHLEATIAKGVGEKKARDTKSVIEKLENSLVSEPKGINRDAVDFLMTGQSPAGTADPDQLLEVFAKALELCPGVTVDRSELEMDEHFVQFILRLYNLPETRSITPAKPRKGEDADPTDENGDENEAETEA